MKIISWNVNGIRACITKGFLDFVNENEYLKSLNMVYKVEPLTKFNLPRAAQLIQRTNQFNLRTKRYSEADLKTIAASGQHISLIIHLKDKFGDSGLVGILSYERSKDSINIVDLILSCRVFGRQIEETMIYFLVEQTKDKGQGSLIAKYIQTDKNKPCFTFLKKTGFFH